MTFIQHRPRMASDVKLEVTLNSSYKRLLINANIM